jgi:hypothetical protein
MNEYLPEEAFVSCSMFWSSRKVGGDPVIDSSRVTIFRTIKKERQGFLNGAENRNGVFLFVFCYPSFWKTVNDRYMWRRQTGKNSPYLYLGVLI